MDDLDRASERETEEREARISEVRRRESMPITGACYWCGEMCAGLFCCAECRDDHQRDQDAKRRAGR